MYCKQVVPIDSKLMLKVRCANDHNFYVDIGSSHAQCVNCGDKGTIEFSDEVPSSYKPKIEKPLQSAGKVRQPSTLKVK